MIETIQDSLPPTRLYIKHHTGLKYFGKTVQDPYKYMGSGSYWLNYVKKHNTKLIETLWVSEEFTSVSEINEFAEFFSEFFSIVEAKDWANLKPETGLGCDGEFISKMHKPKSEETKQRMRKPKSEEHKKRIAEALRGVPHPEERRLKNSVSHKTPELQDLARNNFPKDMVGSNHPNYGKKLSQETKDKISKTHKTKTLERFSNV